MEFTVQIAEAYVDRLERLAYQSKRTPAQHAAWMLEQLLDGTGSLDQTRRALDAALRHGTISGETYAKTIAELAVTGERNVV